MGRLTEMIQVLNCEPKKLNGLKMFLSSYVTPHDISSIRRDYSRGLLSDLPSQKKKNESVNESGSGLNQQE